MCIYLRLPKQRAQQHTHARFLRALAHNNVKGAGALGNLCGSLEHPLATAVARFNAHNDVAGVPELCGELISEQDHSHEINVGTEGGSH